MKTFKKKLVLKKKYKTALAIIIFYIFVALFTLLLATILKQTDKPTGSLKIIELMK